MNTDPISSRFDMHGNTTLYLTQEVLDSEPILLQTSPMPIKAGRARELIKTFLKSNASHHSGRASTVWVLVEHCKNHKIDYCLTGTPAEGYLIEK